MSLANAKNFPMTEVSTGEGTGVLSTFNFRGARRQASEAPDSLYPPSVSNLEAIF